jgi:hypothetical protein
MTIQKIRLGTNEDGSPMYHYECDGPVVLTGPIQGTVTLPDGTEVDVTDTIIEVESDEQGVAVAEAIAERHVAEGHPDFAAEPHDFVKE